MKKQPVLDSTEIAVIISALSDQITSDRKFAVERPAVAPYAIRNIEFRTALIEKLRK